MKPGLVKAGLVKAGLVKPGAAKRRHREVDVIASYVAAETLVRRAAGLLHGGVPVSRVWKVLARDARVGKESQTARGAADGVDRVAARGAEHSSGGEDGARAVLEVIAAQLAQRGDTARALAAVGSPQWRTLSAMWQVAELSGAPLARALERFADTLASLTKLAEHRRVLLAGPRATLRLVLALPPVALLVGFLLGFNPFRALASPAGIGAAAAGLALLALGGWWAAVMTRRVAQADWAAGWEYELMAVGLRGGAPPALAARWAVECADRADAEWVRMEAFSYRGAVTRVVESGASLGGPLASLLRAEAERERARAQAELEQAAERLAIRVLYPLGACVLPAFVLLGVVPVLLAVLSGAGV